MIEKLKSLPDIWLVFIVLLVLLVANIVVYALWHSSEAWLTSGFTTMLGAFGALLKVRAEQHPQPAAGLNQ